VCELSEELEFSSQLFHDLSVYCNANKATLNHAKDVLVRHVTSIHNTEKTLTQRGDRQHTKHTHREGRQDLCLRAIEWSLVLSCVYQVNVGSVAFPDVLPTYTFCEASPEEVERALLEAQTQGYDRT
jgi:hypothetical protein